MKGALIGLLIGFSFLALLYATTNINSGKATIDVQLHDTYFVLSYSTLIIFLTLFLGTFLSIGGLIGSHLKSKPFWLLLVIFILFNTYYSVRLYKAFNPKETTSPVTK